MHGIDFIVGLCQRSCLATVSPVVMTKRAREETIKEAGQMARSIGYIRCRQALAIYLRENDGNPTAVDSHKSIKAPVVEHPPPPLLSVCSRCERCELMITAASGRDSSEFVITSVRHPGGSGKLRSCVYGNYRILPSIVRSFISIISVTFIRKIVFNMCKKSYYRIE